MPGSPRLWKLLIPGLCAQLLGAPQAATQFVDPTIYGRQAALKPVMEQAQKDLEARRFAQAAQGAEACLQKIPDYFEAHFLLAQIAYEYRDFEGALAHLEVAERNLRDLARLYQSQLDAIRAQDDADLISAEANFDQLLARGVDPSACSGGLYRIRQKKIDDLQAKKGAIHDQELPFSIPAPYFLLHGNCLFRLGRRDEAVAYYRMAVQADPALGFAWNNLIRLECLAKDFAQARADLAKAEAAQVVIRPELKKAVLEGK
jgi:tetratricopeptide (TPR) repeat protein